ncbi:hypothetical protein KY284_030361 [Solanum tuberosum]|nr:hypothetical protein KY284_030361 [Solanum tuberosum]
MASSSKSPEETKILTSSDTSLAIVRKESPPDVIWVSMDGIVHIMSINDSPSLSADEQVHFQELPLVFLPDALSEWEVKEHASFRVALDGFANWSSSRRRLKTVNKDSVSNPMSEPSSPIDILSLPTVRVPQTTQKCRQVEVELISALAARNKTRSSACHPLQTPTIVLFDDDIVSRRDRRGKHITSKPSRSKHSAKAKKSSLPKASPKPASKIHCSKQSTSKSKTKQVASPFSYSSSMSDFEVENPTQSYSSVVSSQLDRIIHFRQ